MSRIAGVVPSSSGMTPTLTGVVAVAPRSPGVSAYGRGRGAFAAAGGPFRSGVGPGGRAAPDPRVADALARPGADLARWAVRVRRLSVNPVRCADRP
ncbi:hypothetical protein PV779_29760 [Streptomyces sp. ID01-9D]|nr:hypothetical protein [Streptomyces sp. ID01-9D]